MQSDNYVSGVSGWKIEKNMMELNGGPWGPILIGDLDVSPTRETEAVEAPPEPFIVVDGVAYINEAFIKDGTIGDKIDKDWSVKLELRKGDYVAADIGLGIENTAAGLQSQFLVSADKFRIKCMCGGGPAGFSQK